MQSAYTPHHHRNGNTVNASSRNPGKPARAREVETNLAERITRTTPTSPPAAAAAGFPCCARFDLLLLLLLAAVLVRE
uniref:Uncharacterized protein n=1 Tax=Oryza rufipogon TaxID=4529 RepID=A0A0E0N4Y7_ORYRU